MCEVVVGHVMLTSNEMIWVPAPPILPAGVKIVVIEGDPREVGPFTMRLLFPAATRLAPHFHPGIEHATVLSGGVYFGMGKAYAREKLHRFPAGSFIVMPPGSPHFSEIGEDAVLQAHGIGPWQTTFVNSADDPSKR
jgi:quercetin dioxygenase-like cupin family protein